MPSFTSELNLTLKDLFAWLLQLIKVRRDMAKEDTFMASKRNIVEEILEIRQRRKWGEPGSEIFIRLSDLQTAFENVDRSDEEIIKYFPIALVACIESYFRMAIKQLIDIGDPYLTNAKEYFQKSNLSFEILYALHGKTITIGDLVSHSISINNLSQIMSFMEKILDENFKEALSAVKDRWEVEVEKQPEKPILSDAHETFKFVTRTFELRHIFCHEVAGNHDFDIEEIEKCFDNAVLFLKAVDEYLSQVIHPNFPLTQREMNIESSKEYEEERKKLEFVLSNLDKLLSPEQKKSLSEANEAWKAFLKANLEIEGLPHGKGSIRPMIESLAAARLTRERVHQVSKLVELLETEGRFS